MSYRDSSTITVEIYQAKLRDVKLEYKRFWSLTGDPEQVLKNYAYPQWSLFGVSTSWLDHVKEWRCEMTQIWCWVLVRRPNTCPQTNSL